MQYYVRFCAGPRREEFDGVVRLTNPPSDPEALREAITGMIAAAFGFDRRHLEIFERQLVH